MLTILWPQTITFTIKYSTAKLIIGLPFEVLWSTIKALISVGKHPTYMPCRINNRNTCFMATLRGKNIKAPFTVGHKGHII